MVPFSGASGAVNSFDDTNNNKILGVTAELPVGGHNIGASYLTDLGGHTAAGGYANATFGKLGLTAEYIASEYDKYLANLGALQNRGYYLLATYAVKPSTTVYARYDTLNNAAIEEKARATVGAAVRLTEHTELTVEYQLIDDPAQPALNGAVGVQLQGKF